MRKQAGRTMYIPISKSTWFSEVKQIFIILTGLLIFSTSCEKIKYYPDKGFTEVKTVFLTHRGGGFSVFPENSLPACEYGFSMLGGIEVDLQISKDRTIWLSHNAELADCGGVTPGCFPEAYDYEILKLDSCYGDSVNFAKLEEIFQLMAGTYTDKYISLDVKAWTPCKISSSDVTGIMNVIADEIIRLTGKYSLQSRVMVESETATFLNRVKKYGNGIGFYLTSFGDIERAMQLCLESGFTGISYKYKSGEEINRDNIGLLRRSGLKIQLWTVNDTNDLKEAYSLNPDFIQTDNAEYVKQKW